MTTTGKIPITVEFGIKLCNTKDAVIKDHSNTADILGAEYMGPLREKGAVTKYMGLSKSMLLSVNVNGMSNIEEIFTSIADQFNRTLYIRDEGSGSIEFFNFIDDDATKLDAHNLAYAAKYYPDGFTSVAAAAATYDPVDDDADLIGFGDAYPRYNIVLESQIDTDKYFQLIFRSVRIKCSPQYQTQRGVRMTLEWEDARDVDIVERAAASLIEYTVT